MKIHRVLYTTEDTNYVLYISLNFFLEKEPKRYTNELIVDTEHALRQLDPKLQNTYRHLAAKQIKHIRSILSVSM